MVNCMVLRPKVAVVILQAIFLSLIRFLPVIASLKYFLFPVNYHLNFLNLNGGKPLLASNGKIYGLNYTGNLI